MNEPLVISVKDRNGDWQTLIVTEVRIAETFLVRHEQGHTVSIRSARALDPEASAPTPPD